MVTFTQVRVGGARVPSGFATVLPDDVHPAIATPDEVHCRFSLAERVILLDDIVLGLVQAGKQVTNQSLGETLCALFGILSELVPRLVLNCAG